MAEQPISVTVPDISEQDILHVPDDHFKTANVAIVTGAASGIGRATAVALAHNGLTVAITDIDGQGIDDTENIIKNMNGDRNVVTITADLTDDGDLRRIVRVSSEQGDIQYLANVAGIRHFSSMENFPMDAYDTSLSVMLRAPSYLSKLFIYKIRKEGRERGCIGNMSSVQGHYVSKNKMAYNCSKFGVRGLTQSIAAEGNGNIRSFSISPGPVRTPHIIDRVKSIAQEKDIPPEEVVEQEFLTGYRLNSMIEPMTVANYFTIGFSKMGMPLNGGDILLDGGKSLTYE